MPHSATDLLWTDLTVPPGLSFPHGGKHPMTTNGFEGQYFIVFCHSLKELKKVSVRHHYFT